MSTVKQAVHQQPAAVFRTNLPLPNRREGKVRDVYSLESQSGRTGEAGGASRMLIVATDRISAFDVVMPTPIPGKGKLLTEISTRWFELIRNLGIVNDHLLSLNAADVPGLTSAQRT